MQQYQNITIQTWFGDKFMVWYLFLQYVITKDKDKKKETTKNCPSCVSFPVPAVSAYHFVSFRYLFSSLFLNTGKPKCLHVSHLKLPGTSTVTRTMSLSSPSPPAPSATLASSWTKNSHSNMYFLLKYYHMLEFILFTNLNLYSYRTLGRTAFYINYQNI